MRAFARLFPGGRFRTLAPELEEGRLPAPDPATGTSRRPRPEPEDERPGGAVLVLSALACAPVGMSLDDRGAGGDALTLNGSRPGGKACGLRDAKALVAP